MRLKTVALSLLALLVVGLVFADNFSGPAGRFISVGGSIDLLGDVNTSGKANGNCLVYNTSTGKWAPGVCGSGGGSSSLSVNVGGVQISSPTSALNFSSSTFNVAQGPVGTSTVTLNFSSVTAVGNVFNAANKLLLLDGTGKVSDSLLQADVSLFGNSVDLPSQSQGNYVQSVVAGSGVSISPISPGHGTDNTFSINPGTLTGDQSWADGIATPVTWRWVVPGVAPRLTFSDNLIQTLSEFDAPTFVGTTMSADTISAGISMTSGGKNVAQYSDTVIAYSTVAYSSGTIQNLNTATLKFNDGTTMTTAATGGPGGFWVGKATSSLDMNGFAITGSTLVATSSFSVTGATETIFGINYVRASSTTVGTGQKLLVYTAAAGKMTESIQDIITNGMTTTSTDTKSGALILQSSFTLPSVNQMGNPASAGQLAYSTSTAGSSWGGTVLFDGKQRMNAVMTATDSVPLAGWVPTFDATGRILWEAQSGSGGGAGTPGGNNTEIQFNNAGSFNGVAVATYNATTRLLTFSSAVTHVNVSSETFNNVRLVLSGTSAIQWADGTVQVSSPTAGGGGGSGTITGVTAGYGLSGGGTSGGVTLNLVNNSTSYIQNSNTLQSGSTAYPAFLYVGSSATVYGPVTNASDYGATGRPLILQSNTAFNASNKMSLVFQQHQDVENLVDAGGLSVGWTSAGGTQNGDVRLLQGVDNGSNGNILAPAIRSYRNATEWRTDFGAENSLDGGGTTITNPVLATVGISDRIPFTDTTGHLLSSDLTGALPVTVLASSFPVTGVTSGSYTNTNLTVNAQGMITAASNGSAGGGGGASSLAVTTGSATGFSVVTTSPTAVVNFSSDTFKVALTGSSTAFVTLNPSSVTLLGPTIPLGTNTSGNYVANTNTNASMTGGTAGSAGASLTLGVDPSSGTLQGNTFNAASKLVQLNSSTQYPALDGSLIVKVSSLAAVVAAGSYGSATISPTITFNAQGQIIAVSSNTIIGGSGGGSSGNDAGSGWITRPSTFSALAVNQQFTGASSVTVNNLSFFVVAGATVTGEFVLGLNSSSSNTGGFKFLMTGPTNPASFEMTGGGSGASITTANLSQQASALNTKTQTFLGTYSSGAQFYHFSFSLINGPNTGTVTVQIVPATGAGTNTINTESWIFAVLPTTGTVGGGTAQDFDLKDATGTLSANKIAAGSLGPSVLVSSLTAVVAAGTYGSATVSPTLTFNAQGQIIAASSNTISTVSGSTGAVTMIFDGGGSAITTGSTSTLTIPYDCTISSWTVLAPRESGSVTVGISKASFANFPAWTDMVGGSGNTPTLSSAQKNSSAPTSWSSTSLAKGDTIAFLPKTASTVTWVQITLWLIKS